MNGIGAGILGGGDDLVDDQVAFPRRGRAQTDRLIRFTHMGQGGVGLGVDRHGGNSLLVAGADNTPGNFATVGDQEFFYLCHSSAYIGGNVVLVASFASRSG